MIDFLRIATRSTRRGVVEIYPKFVILNPSDDLMIRGGDFYNMGGLYPTKIIKTSHM